MYVACSKATSLCCWQGLAESGGKKRKKENELESFCQGSPDPWPLLESHGSGPKLQLQSNFTILKFCLFNLHLTEICLDMTCACACSKKVQHKYRLQNKYVHTRL